jgi:putative flippase GtrA
LRVNHLSTYAVVVPSLHPVREHFLPFLEELVRKSPGAVVVIDDGSGEDYQSLFARAEELGCLVLRHPENRGKGRALKTGLRHCVEHLSHLSGVITADSDGQHTADDIDQVAAELDELAAAGTPAVVLGSRAFEASDVPSRSRWGNTVTTAVIKMLFGRRVSDTQTGLRGLPLEVAARAVDIKGEKFDYEMNQLIWLITTRHQVVEVPIRTIYHDTANSISRFRPVRDSLWIYFLILRQFLVFIGVSAASAVIDLAAYYVLIDFVFGAGRTTAQVALAVALARVLSSMVNFALNRTVVFRDPSAAVPAARRYYLLAVVIMLASSAGTAALSVLSGGHDMWAKILCDAVLFCVSYAVQQRWVFARRPPSAKASRSAISEGRR